MQTIVVALGGNALGNNQAEQLVNAGIAAKSIVDLIEAGNRVVIAHGNGPQVGVIKLLMNAGDAAPMPLVECTAMSQGYIGYHIQMSIGNELAARGMQKEVVSVLSQVVVDAADPAFDKPTKPIGAFYDEEKAKEMAASTGKAFVEDAGRGWRQVVASPRPVDIVEKNTIKKLVEDDAVVIACGGGGIPVVRSNSGLKGIDAVIDKDFAAAKMAELINADVLFILTAVERVSINFNKPDQKDLETLTIAQAKQYIEEGHFAPGSMLPKVQACMSFAEGKSGRKAIIGALEKAAEAIIGESGTTIK